MTIRPSPDGTTLIKKRSSRALSSPGKLLAWSESIKVTGRKRNGLPERNRKIQPTNVIGK
jgi:hypothetical protein